MICSLHMAHFSMVQAHGTERYNCDTLEDLTRKFIPNEKRNFTCWIRMQEDKGRDTKSNLTTMTDPWFVYPSSDLFSNGALRRIRITSIWDRRIINSIIFPITGCIFSTISCSIFCWKNKGNALKFTQSG